MWRLYYRAGILDLTREEETYVLAMAESTDGLDFHRPEFGLCEFQGTTRNNILQIGGFPNPPPPFFDLNPASLPNQRFKGITQCQSKPFAMASPDGLRWHSMQAEPLNIPGQFDTVNTAFWDTVAGCYRCYTRRWLDPETGSPFDGWHFGDVRPVRGIQHSTSHDFLHWSQPELLHFADGDQTVHLYTNAILPCPGAEHHLLGFPNRYVPERKLNSAHPLEGVNDALFMASRDGAQWERWLDAWVPPGVDPMNWTERNNYPVWGIVETSATEWSMYVTEHYRQKEAFTRMRRLAIRPWGFVSVHGDYSGGEMLTKPFLFDGRALRINARTSAAGSVRVEILDKNGHVLPGFGLDDMEMWFGDGLDIPVTWKQGGDLAQIGRRPIRLRFLLKDADLYDIQFSP
jgi:hypothetical protein